MLRNKYFEREKEWLEASRKADQLYPYAHPRVGGWRWRDILYKPDTEYIHWEPLAKPEFAGWELWVELSEERKRSRDAPDLQQVIDMLELSKPQFWRHQPSIRLIRRCGHRYRDAVSYLEVHRGHHWFASTFGNRKITGPQYESLGHLQKYFGVYNNPGNSWTPPYKEYYLDWKFPDYELRFKVKKSYNNFIGHLYGDEIGEYNKLVAWLYSDATASIRASLGYSGRWRQDYSKSIKIAWKNATRKIQVAANTFGVLDEDWVDIEQDLKDKSRVYKHYPFGYD